MSNRFATRTVVVLTLGLALAACGGGGGGGGGSGALLVKAIVPADATMGVSASAPVQVTFSRAVDPASVVIGTTFVLAESATPGTPIAGTSVLDATGKVLTFTPAAPLAFLTDHRVTLTAGILDPKGKALDLSKAKVPLPSTFQTAGAPDGIAPTFGGASSAMALSDTRIDVQWSAASDNVDAPAQIIYNVYVATASGTQTFATPDLTTAPGALTAARNGLVASTDYFIVVRAEDTSGNEDTNTVEVMATTLAGPDVTPPTFAGATSATALDSTSVQLDWAPATDDIAPAGQIVYNVYIALTPAGQSFGTPDATSAPGATSFVVGGLLPQTDYFFVVRAEDPSGNEETNTIERSDRTFISFTTQVGPIFSGSCSCHGGPAPTQGQNLSSYADIVATAIDVPANQTSATSMLDRIEPFDHALSYLWHKIEGTQNDPAVMGSGGQMPASGCCLPQGERDLIRDWIDEGALDQ